VPGVHEVEIKMKRIIPIVCSLLAVSAGAFAQDQAAIDKALMAAPAQLKAGATVIKWKPDYTYDTLKKGTNTTVCYDKTGMPGVNGFMAECTSMGNLPREAQDLKFEAMPGKGKAALEAAEKDGTRVKPEFGSVWYHAMGTDAEHVTRMHMTIAVPGATTATLGLPESGKSGSVWIMNAGTTTAHLMTPGE
jgi:hypothetical protein